MAPSATVSDVSDSRTAAVSSSSSVTSATCTTSPLPFASVAVPSTVTVSSPSAVSSWVGSSVRRTVPEPAVSPAGIVIVLAAGSQAAV